MSLIIPVIDTLLKGETPDEKYRDHALVGDRKGQRELHITPDWLLINTYIEDALILTLMETGT